MGGMESFDFTQVPGFGTLMQLTGLSDGWVLVAALALLLALIFLFGWMRSASKGRAARRELAQVKEELVGAQALVNLPPLHEGDYDYLNGDDPGSSLVFASVRELRRRNSAAEAPAAAPAAQQPASQSPAQEPEHAPAAEPAPSVAAQVHEAIYASVTSSKFHAQRPEQEPASDMVGNRRRKPNGAAITSSDLPPIKAEPQAKHPDAGSPVPQRTADPDASLSSRIPRL